MAKMKNISLHPHIAMIATQAGGTITGPNFAAARKIPVAVPFSWVGNQLLIVDAKPTASGPSEIPSATLRNFSVIIEFIVPMSPVQIDVAIIENENSFLTPNLLIRKPDGNWANA